MSEASPGDRASLLRAVAFAGLAAVTAFALASGIIAPAADRDEARKVELYRATGDTFLRMYYIGGGPESAEPGTHGFLEEAGQYYRWAAERNPAEVESIASLAAVLHELGSDREAESWLARAAAHRHTPAEEDALRTVHALVASAPLDPETVRSARGVLGGLTAGPLVLARVYERMGERELADKEWQAAETRGRSLLPSFIAMLVVVGLVTLMGAVGLAMLLVRSAWRRGEAGAAVGTEPRPAGWTVRAAVESLVLWVFLGMATSVALGGSMLAARPGREALLVVPTLAAGCGAIAWVLAVSPRGTRIGWRWEHAWRQVAIGMAAAGICTLPAMGLYRVLQNVLVRGPVVHPLVPVFVGASGWASRAGLIAAAAVAVPVLEETLFRGVLYRALRRQWSFWWAAGASAAVFSVGHLSTAGLLPYWLLGVFFAYLYERSGSLLVPAVAHGVFNGCNLAILLVIVG